MVLIRFKGSLKKALRKVFPEVQFPGKERGGVREREDAWEDKKESRNHRY